MRKAPLISIIIVNWNGGQVFKNCLESLAKIDYPRWELIVVDNGSTDGSEREVGKLIKLTKLIKNKKNVGFAPANNQGLKWARGKYVLLLNNDTKVDPDLLTKLVGRMEKDESLGVVQPKIFLMDKPGLLDNAGTFVTRIGFLHNWGFMGRDGPEFSQEREIFSAKGACMLARKRIIDKVGLFDEDFISYFEESDFCWRVWLAGYRVLFYPEAAIEHKLGYTIKRQSVLANNYHNYKNRICSLIKNLEGQNLILILPVHIFISLGVVLIFTVRGSANSGFLIIRAMGWNMVNLGKTLEKRRKIQETRRVSDSKIFEKVGQRVDWRMFFSDFRRVEKDIKR